MGLWANANKALDDLLNTKVSIDTRRQRAVWELGVVLHQNESQAAASIKEAKTACSQGTLDVRTTCSQLILEGKTGCLVAVKKAKTTRGCLVQETKAACSKAICEVKAWRVSQAAFFPKENGNFMWDLEEQVIGEESRRYNDFLSACQVILYNSLPELKGALATSYHILLGQTPLSSPPVPPQKISLVEEQPTTATFPTPVPKQSPRPKRWHPSPDHVESMIMGGTTLKARGPPSSQRQEFPPWFRTLKPNHAETFTHDFDMVRGAREEFFSKHSYNFTTDGTCNLSGTFRQLAVRANLLGTSIHEIQASWTRPKELQQANYAS